MKIAQTTLNEKQAQYCMQSTTKGLIHLHSRNILHLDIKCANILMTEDGVVKLGTYEKLGDFFFLCTGDESENIHIFCSGLWCFW